MFVRVGRLKRLLKKRVGIGILRGEKSLGKKKKGEGKRNTKEPTCTD